MPARVTVYLCPTHDQEQPCNQVKDATEAMTSDQHVTFLVQNPAGASYCARASDGSYQGRDLKQPRRHRVPVLLRDNHRAPTLTGRRQ